MRRINIVIHAYINNKYMYISPKTWNTPNLITLYWCYIICVHLGSDILMNVTFDFIYFSPWGTRTGLVDHLAGPETRQTKRNINYYYYYYYYCVSLSVLTVSWWYNLYAGLQTESFWDKIRNLDLFTSIDIFAWWEVGPGAVRGCK